SGLLDAQAATGASGTSSLLPACIGLAAPLAVPVGLGVWAFRVVFLSAEAWSPRQFWATLERQRGPGRAAWLVMPPLVALAALLGLVAVSGVSARLLAMDLTGTATFALAPLSIVPLVFALLGGVRVLSLALEPRLDAERLSPRL